MTPAGEARLRPAARAVVVDPASRVLLVHLTFPRWRGWVTPGGGMDPGETTAESVARELREEAGLVDAPIGPVVWHRRWFGQIGGWDGQEEWFHFVPVPAFDPVPHFTAEELAAEHVTGIRWWTLAELAATSEQVAPDGLPALVQSLIDHGPPPEPLEL
jgi:8-oxo-dGTP pyrophosphatase MutT (NUDIX family)